MKIEKFCPYCGNEEEGEKDLFVNDLDVVFAVECLNCGSRGPTGTTKEEAIHGFNCRADCIND